MELVSVPITDFAGVGEKVASKLAKLNIFNAQNVLFHLPMRYEDRTTYTPIAQAQAETSVLIRGEIQAVQQLTHGRRSLVIQISDDSQQAKGSGDMVVRLFHFSFSQKQAFKVGYWLECFGELILRPGTKEMIQPDYRVLPKKPEKPLTDTLTPVYPSTEGVSQHLLRKITDQALNRYLVKVSELLPTSLLEKYNFVPLIDALTALHRPTKGMDLEQMMEMDSPIFRRLIFEELLAFHMSLNEARKKRIAVAAIPCPLSDHAQDIRQQFNQQLSFELTGAQKRVIQEISQDMTQTNAMARMLQGDVGSGKTVVAAFAILQALASNVQVALMAPTELLAEQLFNNINTWFTPLGIQVEWLTGKSKTKQRTIVTEGLADGSLGIVVGTHALFQKGVEFKKLGLVIIDEQHRFGVGQRLALVEKTKAEDLEAASPSHATAPHQLVMSATPIPRTLAMSIYGDIHVSTIDELPPNRLSIDTVVVPADSRREDVVQRVKEACMKDTQVYWVCPLIEESEVLQAQAVTDVYADLSARLSQVRVAMIHGQMKPSEKETIMQSFRDHEIDLLLATTVIEVGVDVPNASLMIIENAERMGLAQLHQLRGRVGRGSKKSVCVLLYQAPLSHHAKLRLQTMRETNDGFDIARKDLELRGPGEMLGVKQTGAVSLRIANLVRDEKWLETISVEAQNLSQNSPEIVEKLITRWFANQQQFAHV